MRYEKEIMDWLAETLDGVKVHSITILPAYTREEEEESRRAQMSRRQLRQSTWNSVLLDLEADGVPCLPLPFDKLSQRQVEICLQCALDECLGNRHRRCQLRKEFPGLR